MKLTPETARLGDGATYQIGSDRYAGTIVGLSPSAKTLEWQPDDCVLEWAEGAQYGDEPLDITYTPNTRKATSTFRWSTKSGCYKSGYRFMMAGRHHYRDPSF